MREKNEQNQNFPIAFFSTVRRVNGTLRVYFTLEQLKLFIYNSFASLYCGYLGAAPIPYVQDTVLNLHNPYLRRTTVLLDITTFFLHLNTST